MGSNTKLLCVNRWRDTASIDGYRMPCARVFSDLTGKFGGVLAPFFFHIEGIHVPIFRGGPPAYKE